MKKVGHGPDGVRALLNSEWGEEDPLSFSGCRRACFLQVGRKLCHLKGRTLLLLLPLLLRPPLLPFFLLFIPLLVLPTSSHIHVLCILLENENPVQSAIVFAVPQRYPRGKGEKVGLQFFGRRSEL